MKWMQFFTPVKSMDTDQTREYIDSHPAESYTLLDVRQPKEYESAHIPGSLLIPLPELSAKLDNVPQDKPVLVYCAVGGRSRVAAQMLAGKGFKSVMNVAGGIKAWNSHTAVGDTDLGMDLFSGKETPEDILKVAYSLEQGLRDFYLKMEEKAASEKVKDLFSKLSEIEVKHQMSIYLAFNDLGVEDVSKDEFEKMVTARSMEGGLTTEQYLELFPADLEKEEDVIGLAMTIEAQALDLYQRVARNIKSESSRDIVLKIAAEEQAHLSSLGHLMDQI